ncbi:MAG: M48 family metallopeptidase [Candidatus Omnitrophica bacterium]|nr:M48 family metallopeptidase [Candidatus Omnitrophota bacterium]
MTQRRAISLALAAWIAFGGCATQKGFSRDFESRLTSAQNDWGLRTAPDLRAMPPGIPKPDPSHPLSPHDLQSILDRLVFFSPLRGHRVPLGIVLDPELNASANPNGVIVTTGLIATFQYSPDALAAVMAHELGHLLAGHSPDRKRRGAWLEVLSYATPALSVLPYGGLYGPAAGTALRESAKIRRFSYSRVQENEADALGVLIATQAGFSPHGLGDFLDHAGGGSGFGIPQTISFPTSVGAIPQSAAVALLSSSPLYRLHPPSSKRKQVVRLMSARATGQITQEALKKECPWLEKIYTAFKDRQAKTVTHAAP